MSKTKKKTSKTPTRCPQPELVKRKNEEIEIDTHQQFDELLSNREFAYEMAKVGFPRVHLQHDHIWAGDDHDQEIVEMMNKSDYLFIYFFDNFYFCVLLLL